MKRQFMTCHLIKEEDNLVNVPSIMDPALGKKGRQSIEQWLGDTLQSQVVGQEKQITKRLIFRELLSIWEQPPERERRVLEKSLRSGNRRVADYILCPTAGNGWNHPLGGRRVNHLERRWVSAPSLPAPTELRLQGGS
jgi:hypothetical protein